MINKDAAIIGTIKYQRIDFFGKIFAIKPDFAIATLLCIETTLGKFNSLDLAEPDHSICPMVGHSRVSKSANDEKVLSEEANLRKNN